MALIDDPESVLPDHKKKVSPSQIISLLLYPVIFLVGLSIGVVIGFKQNPISAAGDANNKNAAQVNSKIIPNVNTTTNTPDVSAANAHGNTNTVVINTNNALSGGDFVKLDAQTESTLKQQQQRDLDTLVDQTASFTDVLRQQDLINLKYNALTFYAVNKAYPSTDGKQIHLDKGANDVYYQSMKEFYGGSFYEKIDPESPKYYYGYSSDGQTFQLTSYLPSKQKPFILNDTP